MSTELSTLLEQSAPRRIWSVVTAVGQTVVMLVLCAILWRVVDLLDTQAGVGRCRSELAADAAIAQGNVILVLTESALTPATTPAAKALVTTRVREAASELRRTQERRARTNEICG